MPPATRIVTGVDFVAVSTNDFEKARDFYANISVSTSQSAGAACRPRNSRPGT